MNVDLHKFLKTFERRAVWPIKATNVPDVWPVIGSVDHRENGVRQCDQKAHQPEERYANERYLFAHSLAKRVHYCKVPWQ